MDKIVIARYGEIHLKGDNRGFFLRALKRNIEFELPKLKVSIENNRVVVEGFTDGEADVVAKKLANVFGIVSVSKAAVLKHPAPSGHPSMAEGNSGEMLCAWILDYLKKFVIK